MVTKELIDYISIEKGKGTDRGVILGALKMHGWNDADVEEAEAVIAKSTNVIKENISVTIPDAPSGRIRDYFTHFSAENMVEFSLGIVICLWQIYSLIYITYFALLNTQLNLFNYLLHFVAFAVGVALIRNASHRAQKRYIDALVGKKSN